MSHRQLAATSWEVEAERRREVLGDDLRRIRRSDGEPRAADIGRRVRAWFATPRRLDQERA